MQRIINLFKFSAHKFIPMIFLVLVAFGGICIAAGLNSKITFSNSDDNLSLNGLMEETKLNFFQIYKQFNDLNGFVNNYPNLNLDSDFLAQFGAMKDFVMAGFILMMIAIPFFVASVTIYIFKTPIFIRRFRENRKLTN